MIFAGAFVVNASIFATVGRKTEDADRGTCGSFPRIHFMAIERGLRCIIRGIPSQKELYHG